MSLPITQPKTQQPPQQTHTPSFTFPHSRDQLTKAKRNEYTHHLLKTLYITVYSMYILRCIYFFWYLYAVYILIHLSTKKYSILKYIELPKVFNSHFLMVPSHTQSLLSTNPMSEFHKICSNLQELQATDL